MYNNEYTTFSATDQIKPNNTTRQHTINTYNRVIRGHKEENALMHTYILRSEIFQICIRVYAEFFI